VFYPDELAAPAFSIVDANGTTLETVGRGGYSAGFESNERVPAALGRGRFGTVYRGKDDDGNDVAIKVVPRLAPGAARDRIAKEARMLGALDGAYGVPQLLWSGTQQVFGQPAEVLVMEKLGVDVESYRVKAVGDAVVRDSAGAARFAPDAMLRVGRDVLRALRSLAEARIVHNDIKPTNILFGDGSRRAHLADYGMATECDAAACDAPDIRYGGGTPLFASLAAQEGMPTTPADDLESLWYTLAYLAHGTLPWQWEEPSMAARIKRSMFTDECSIASDAADCHVDVSDCATSHCRNTVEHWLDGQLGADDDVLQGFWEVIVDLKADPEEGVDWDACMEALGGGAWEGEVT